jgi:hypothetical protein
MMECALQGVLERLRPTFRIAGVVARNPSFKELLLLHVGMPRSHELVDRPVVTCSLRTPPNAFASFHRNFWPACSDCFLPLLTLPNSIKGCSSSVGYYSMTVSLLEVHAPKIYIAIGR